MAPGEEDRRATKGPRAGGRAGGNAPFPSAGGRNWGVETAASRTRTPAEQQPGGFLRSPQVPAPALAPVPTPAPAPTPTRRPLLLRRRWPHQLRDFENAPRPREPAQEEVGGQAAARAPAGARGRLGGGTVHRAVVHRPLKVARSPSARRHSKSLRGAAGGITSWDSAPASGQLRPPHALAPPTPAPPQPLESPFFCRAPRVLPVLTTPPCSAAPRVRHAPSAFPARLLTLEGTDRVPGFLWTWVLFWSGLGVGFFYYIYFLISLPREGHRAEVRRLFRESVFLSLRVGGY